MGISMKWGFLTYWRAILVFVLPLILLPIPILGQSKAALCCYAVIIMAVFWMTEAVPIPITAFLPVVFYPLFGIQDSGEVAQEYLKDSIMVFVGGLLVALAFEYSNLHKRIALRVMLATGASIGMLMLGIMLTTMFLSMWMFNTATTAMMVPIIQAVLFELQKSLEEVFQKENEEFYPTKEEEIMTAVNVGITKTDLPSGSTGEKECHQGSHKRWKTAVETSEKQRVVQKGNKELLTDLPVALELEKTTNAKTEGKHNSPTSGKSIEEKTEELRETIQRMRTMFLLATCYSSNIGGTGVVTGSGTNLVALEFLGDLNPKHHGDYASLTFATWMAFNILPMLINVTIAWVYLQLVFIGIPNKLKFWRKESERDISNAIFNPEMECKIKTMLKEKYQDLGSVTTHEIAVGICFVIAVTSWVLHDPKFIPGWSELFHGGPHVSISTATLLIGALFFIIPRNPEFYQAFRTGEFQNVEIKPLLDWEFVRERFPWGVVILLGGGYALSKGAKKAGLSVVIGKSLAALSDLPASAMQIICMALIAGVTEVASNTATASIVIPILLELSKELNIHPLYLTLPATVTCSYAFMLPVATPPNAIVYAAGEMKVIDMVKTGLFMNITCVLVLFATTNLYGNLIFHFTDYNYIP